MPAINNVDIYEGLNEIFGPGAIDQLMGDFELPPINPVALKQIIADAEQLKMYGFEQWPSILKRNNSTKKFADEIKSLIDRKKHIEQTVASMEAKVKTEPMYDLDGTLIIDPDTAPTGSTLEKIRQLRNKLAAIEQKMANIRYAAEEQLALDKSAEFKKLVNGMLVADQAILKPLYEIGDTVTLLSLLDEYQELYKNDKKNLADYAEFVLSAENEVNEQLQRFARQSLKKGEAGATEVFVVSREVLNANPAQAFVKNLGIANEDSGYGDLSQVPNLDTVHMPFVISEEEKLAAQVRIANADLKRQTGYAELPLEVQSQLVEQRAYLIKLHAYITLSDIPKDDPLYATLIEYYRLLQDNIARSLNNQHEASGKAQEDLERIKKILEGKKLELANRLFNKNFYTITNIGAGAAIASTIYAATLNGYTSTQNALALVVSSVAGLYKDAVMQADQIADELMEPMQQLMAAGLSAEEVKKIFNMDAQFEYGLNAINIPEVKQSISGQIYAAIRGASKIFIDGLAGMLDLIGLNKIAEKLRKLNLDLIYNKALGVFKVLSVLILLSVISVLVPAVSPILYATLVALAVSIPVSFVQYSAGKVANKILNGIYGVSDAIWSVPGLIVRSIWNAPKFIWRSISNLFSPSATVAPGISQTYPPQDISENQKKVLNTLDPKLSDMLLANFKEYAAVVNRLIEIARKENNQNPAVVQSITNMISSLESAWDKLKLVIDNQHAEPSHEDLADLCKELFTLLRSYYVCNRELLCLQATEAKNGSAPDDTPHVLSAAELPILPPSFKMSPTSNFTLLNSRLIEMEKLSKFANLVQNIQIKHEQFNQQKM